MQPNGVNASGRRRAGAGLDATLDALAAPARRAIVDRLRAGPRTSSSLADELSQSRPAMSKHLRVLRVAGLIDESLLDSDARVRIIRLRRKPFSELRSWVDEVESFWGDQLSAFKVHAEKKAPSRAK